MNALALPFIVCLCVCVCVRRQIIIFVNPGTFCLATVAQFSDRTRGLKRRQSCDELPRERACKLLSLYSTCSALCSLFLVCCG
jgi:hypothetical protein